MTSVAAARKEMRFGMEDPLRYACKDVLSDDAVEPGVGTVELIAEIPGPVGAHHVGIGVVEGAQFGWTHTLRDRLDARRPAEEPGDLNVKLPGVQWTVACGVDRSQELARADPLHKAG